MGFTQLFSEHFAAWEVETRNGTEIVPCDLFRRGYVPTADDLSDYCEGMPEEWSRVTGWFARYSAPGYLDCTAWCGPYETEQEAIAACKDIYGPEEDEEGDES